MKAAPKKGMKAAMKQASKGKAMKKSSSGKKAPMKKSSAMKKSSLKKEATGSKKSKGGMKKAKYSMDTDKYLIWQPGVPRALLGTEANGRCGDWINAAGLIYLKVIVMTEAGVGTRLVSPPSRAESTEGRGTQANDQFPWQIDLALCLSAFAKARRPAAEFWLPVHDFCVLLVPRCASRQLCLLSHALASVEERARFLERRVMQERRRENVAASSSTAAPPPATFFEALAVEVQTRRDLNDIDFATLLNSFSKVARCLRTVDETTFSTGEHPSARPVAATAKTVFGNLEAFVQNRPAPIAARALANACHAIVKLELKNQSRIVDRDYADQILRCAPNFTPQEQANLLFALGSVGALPRGEDVEAGAQHTPVGPTEMLAVRAAFGATASTATSAPPPPRGGATRAIPSAALAVAPPPPLPASSPGFAPTTPDRRAERLRQALCLGSWGCESNRLGAAVKLMDHLCRTPLKLSEMKPMELVQVLCACSKVILHLPEVHSVLFGLFQREEIVQRLSGVELAIVANALTRWPSSSKPELLLQLLAPCIVRKTLVCGGGGNGKDANVGASSSKMPRRVPFPAARYGEKKLGSCADTGSQQVLPRHPVQVVHAFAKLGVQDDSIFGAYLESEVFPYLREIEPHNVAQVLISLAKVDRVSARENFGRHDHFRPWLEPAIAADFSDTSLVGMAYAHLHPGMFTRKLLLRFVRAVHERGIASKSFAHQIEAVLLAVANFGGSWGAVGYEDLRAVSGLRESSERYLAADAAGVQTSGPQFEVEAALVGCRDHSEEGEGEPQLTGGDPAPAAAATCTHAGVIGDAGSTGTRIYVVYNISAPSGVKIEAIGKQNGGGLAKLGAREAFDQGLGSLLIQAHKRLEALGCAPPSSSGGTTASEPSPPKPAIKHTPPPAPKLAILGTAGTRLMTAAANSNLWFQMRQLVTTTVRKSGIKFEILALRTITGEEEGLFAFLSVNILRGAVDHRLEVKQQLHGVVDLGGASTQVAVPMAAEKGAVLKPTDVFIRSFLGYGTKEFFNRAPAAVRDKCQYGKSGDECQAAIKEVFEKRTVAGTSYVQENTSYFGKSDLSVIANGDKATASVYTISGFYFLAHKYDAEPAPLKHTSKEQLATRCFDACYAVTLLREVYKWGPDTAKFHFTDNVDGNSVDWALGAYISLVNSKAAAGANEGGDAMESYWMPNFAAAALISFFLYVLFRRLWRSGTRPGSPSGAGGGFDLEKQDEELGVLKEREQSVAEEISEFLAAAAAVTAVIQFCGFLHGYAFQTEVFYDALGGLNSLAFVVLAFVLRSPDAILKDPRTLAISTLFALSRLWLLSFLAWRARERKGDGRFDKLKPFFFTFLLVWVMQAIWCYAVALPLLVLDGIVESVPLEASDYAGISLFACGLLAEVHSDVIKARWVQAGRPGGFCTRGLWYYSRHPNYFGEILMWWSAWALTLAPAVRHPDAFGKFAALAVLSPAVTTFLLTCVSGVPLAEGKHLERYQKYNPQFADYRRRTSCLVPMPPSVYERIPRVLQRVFLCKWTMYEYPGGDASGRSKRGRSVSSSPKTRKSTTPKRKSSAGKKKN
eukprot:g1785.t1